MVLLCSGDKVPLWCILLASGVLMFGIPLQGSPNSALYSKLVPQAHQGFMFGCSQVVEGTSRILGPLMSGVALDYASHRDFFLMLVAIWAFAFSLLILMWRKLASRVAVKELSEPLI
eukprot:TRINITY_DN8330_c0_g2_i6.p1 TRINITY_DN8330_c0_g2~~TRINITY_DN8330_c0_g2_i6.p1  ORF type:complete len:117 (-),score=9.28 TRINITY_DN8330_c0_g2_i6:93-443(-)